MSLLKSLWNGLGDAYDNMQSEDNCNFEMERQYKKKREDRYNRPKMVRVHWQGYIHSSIGCTRWEIVDTVISADAWACLCNDGHATSVFLKKIIPDCVGFEYELNYLEYYGEVEDY